jgi:SAM-dependent methyltransferase
MISIPMKGSDILAHPVWQQLFIPGLASVQLLQENVSGGHDQMVVRMGARRAEPALLPAMVCGLCESQEVAEIIRLAEMRIGICRHCHSGMVLGMETAISGTGGADDYSARYIEEFQEEKPESCWRLLRERTDGLRGIKNILDIGCGAGAFLDLAKEKGLSTAGLEIAPTAALAAVRKGHEIFCNSVEKEAFPPGCQFDLIVMWDVLEHLTNPRLALGNAFALLAPRGRLFILTPMMGSVFDRWGIKLARLSGARLNQLLRICWSQYHLFRFHPCGIGHVLRCLGFTQVKDDQVLLLSLKADRYAGGRILHSWTGSPFWDRQISKLGVKLVQALRINNKLLIEASWDREERQDAL